MKRLIIFTDLDGTLLDHETYDFTAADKALKLIDKHAIPLVLCSSKTAVEIRSLQKKLNLKQVFICENGAGVVSATGEYLYAKPSYSEIVKFLSSLKNDFSFLGFSQMTIEQVMENTGLDSVSAEQSKQRDFSEPLVWQDTEERKATFLKILNDNGFMAQQGGRFLTVNRKGCLNKGSAMQYVVNEYFCSETLSNSEQFDVMALGDSPNDLSMLNLADIAVILPSAKKSQMLLDDNLGSKSLNSSNVKQVLTPSGLGPRGWQQAMDQILPQYIHLPENINNA